MNDVEIEATEEAGEGILMQSFTTRRSIIHGVKFFFKLVIIQLNGGAECNRKLAKTQDRSTHLRSMTFTLRRDRIKTD